MIDVTVENFEIEVMQASVSTAVLIDFWATWCQPCLVLGPLLEKLEVAYAGRFKLAKVDADAQQELGSAFGIRSLPTCVLIINGQPVDGFTGAQPEAKVRELLDKHLPAAAPALPAEPEAPLGPAEQLQVHLDTLAKDPAQHEARFQAARMLLAQGRVAEAKALRAGVPAQSLPPRHMASLDNWTDAIEFAALQADKALATAEFDSKIAANKRDFAARHAKAQLLMAAQHWTLAMDELLEILMRDRGWNDGLARKTYVAILDLMEPPKVKVADGQIPPEDAAVASYRRRLSSVILS
ncbi:MAG: tetratricopeptide repeat protein [Burkholderiaceae bacterium]